MTRYSCTDRMCGASDCATCHPEWQGEEPVDDMAEDADDARREDAMMDARERGRGEP